MWQGGFFLGANDFLFIYFRIVCYAYVSLLIRSDQMLRLRGCLLSRCLWQRRKVMLFVSGLVFIFLLGKNTWIPFGAPSTDVDLSESTQEALLPIGLCWNQQRQIPSPAQSEESPTNPFGCIWEVNSGAGSVMINLSLHWTNASKTLSGKKGVRVSDSF